jgi:hypothetical protein
LKTAFLILAHRQPEQLARLVQRLHADWNDIFIHIDLHQDIEAFRSAIDGKLRVHFIAEELRREIHWGGYSIVEATLALIYAALESGAQYDRYCLLSGADYLITDLETIKLAFSRDWEYMRVDRYIGPGSHSSHIRNVEYYHFFDQPAAATPPQSHQVKRRIYDGIRLYHGSAWWALSDACIGYIIDYIADHPEYIDFHRHTFCPDEIFFHSIVKSSPYAGALAHDFEMVEDLDRYMLSNEHGCHYIDWTTPSISKPKVLTVDDSCELKKSSMLFARKFDQRESAMLLELLDYNNIPDKVTESDLISPGKAIVNPNTPVKEKVWVIGDGRSGTTWLSELINYDNRYRYIFEPYHPDRRREMHSQGIFRYMRDGLSDQHLEDFTHRLFTGQVFTAASSVDAGNSLCPQKILIKDIFTHLLAKWVLSRVEGIKLIIIVRHPFGVALSKNKLQKWSWMSEPAAFLSNPDLYEDYLHMFEKVITQASGGFEKQVAIWAVIHYVMFQVLDKDDYHLVYYENLCSRPEKELTAIMSYLGQDKNAVTEAIKNVDRVSRTSSVEEVRDRGRLNYTSWRKQLSDNEFGSGMQILRNFMLDEIYDRDFNPIPGGPELFRKRLASLNGCLKKTPGERKMPMIIVELTGGIGNQMFQFAHGLSISRELDMELRLDTSSLDKQPGSRRYSRTYRLNEFGLDEKVIRPAILQDLGLSIDNERNNSNIIQLEKGINPGDHTILRGWFQGEKYFSNVSDEIRRMFAFGELSSETARQLAAIISKSKNPVAVHVRRGDYINLWNLAVCKPSYFLRAKRHIEKFVDAPVYIVFSEDISYCREFMGKDSIYVDESVSDIDSLHLMQLCRHHIISNSTFSWWGAWLSVSKDGIVIAPSRWVNDETRNHQKLVVDELIGESWHQVDVE